jgi:integrase
LCHLLLLDDLDLERRVIRVRNKPELGWQVKTCGEREVPLVPVLAEVLKAQVGERNAARCSSGARGRTVGASLAR